MRNNEDSGNRPGFHGKKKNPIVKAVHRERSEEKTWAVIGVDAALERCRETKETYGISTYGDLSEAIQSEQPDCAILSTSPLSHAKLIQTCLNAHLHVYTELNLVPDLYDENMKRAREQELFYPPPFCTAKRWIL